MVEGFIRGLLGPFAPIVDWMNAHPYLVALILGVWIAISLAGSWQLRQIRQRTEALVLEVSRKELAARPKTSAHGLYRHILPLWRAELPRWRFWFIPHRLDLWPVPVRPETVLAKIKISPEWIAELLRKNNISLQNKEKKNEPTD